MSWIAMSGQGKSWVCPRTFEKGAAQVPPWLLRGSILIEVDLAPASQPETILSYRRAAPMEAAFSMQMLPDGQIALKTKQGETEFVTALTCSHQGRCETVRITLSWDCAAGFGQFAIEQPKLQTVQAIAIPALAPVLLADILALIRRSQPVDLHPDVVFFAVSDDVEPVGPMPSLLGQTPVLTPTGYRPVAGLQCGDTVKTPQDGVVPVLHRVSRVVPAFGSFRPVRLCAPYFGLLQDVVVAPHQALLIRGSEVEYMFGKETVLVPASSLVNGFAAAYEDGLGVVEYHQLLLPAQEPLIAAGAEVQSLYVGRLRRDAAALNQSLLAKVPRNLMPEHASLGLMVLGPFEAITLTEARAA